LYGSAALPAWGGGQPAPGHRGGGQPPLHPPDDGGTSHFCVADRFGNIVSMTETINGGFGSYVVAEPFGIILNNEMDDFTTVAGEANLYGLTQSAANGVAPGKRPLSSMTPTIIFERLTPTQSRPFLALGGSGGPRIISNVLQVALHAMSRRDLQYAMTEPRLHHQWQPDELYLDRDPPNDRWRHVFGALVGFNCKLSEKRSGAAIQAIQFAPDGSFIGACDPKKGGRPAAP
jgi:gamma-glutamyltranspeptidase/glutathione hydrolase